MKLMFRSEDPVRDAERYMEAQDIRLARRPKCDCCGRHIQDGEALHYVTRAIDIWLCLECIDDNTEWIDDD